MSIDSVNRNTPWLFSTPSTPSGSRGNGSTKGLRAGGALEPETSVTSARPWLLIESMRAGTMSCNFVSRPSKISRGGGMGSSPSSRRNE